MAGEGGSVAGISLNFGKSSKHRPKRVKVNEEEERQHQEFVTGISQNGLELREKHAESTTVGGQLKRVIPTQGNNFRGLGPRGYNPMRFLPQKDEAEEADGDGAERFEVAAPEAQAPVTYGLTTSTRRRAVTDALPEEAHPANQNGAANGSASSMAEGDAPEQGRTGARVLGTGQDWEKDAYRADIDTLPEQASLEAYEAMPVAAFGEAMLRGMGWSEDKETKAPEAREFVRRAPLLGLGAAAAPQSHTEKRFIKPGESRAPKKDLVVYDKEGNIKHTRTASDKLVERIVKGPAVGKAMRVLKGRHSGLLCKVTAIQSPVEGRSQTATVRLQLSEELVPVRVKELGEVDEHAEPEARKQHKAHRQRDEPRLQDKSDERDFKRKHAAERSKEEEQSPAESSGRPVERPWLAAHIRVKVIDKRVGNGRIYLKKGEITDVMSPTLCSLVLDSGERLEAEQFQLETVVPKKEGVRVLVVAGELRGRRAKLLKRSTETSQAAIQLTEDFSIHKVSFDEISEFVGELGEEE